MRLVFDPSNGTHSLAKSMHEINHHATHWPLGRQLSSCGPQHPSLQKGGDPFTAGHGWEPSTGMNVQCQHSAWPTGSKTHPRRCENQAWANRGCLLEKGQGLPHHLGTEPLQELERQAQTPENGAASGLASFLLLNCCGEKKSTGCRRAADTSMRTRPGTALQRAESQVSLCRVIL